MTSIDPGTVVEFYDQRALLLGQCVEVRGKQIRLLTETGRDARISGSRILASYGYVVEYGEPDATKRPQKPKAKKKKAMRRRAQPEEGYTIIHITEEHLGGDATDAGSQLLVDALKKADPDGGTFKIHRILL